MAAEDAARDYKSIREDYTWDPDIFNDEPERVSLVKYIINRRLNEVDRTLIILYADCQSYRKLGKRLGLSHTTIRNEIQRIKAHILEEYERLKQDDR